MKQYTSEELTQALSKLGIKEGDIVYVSTRLFGIGHMKDATDSDTLCKKIYESFYSLIGQSGTVVVPTYTQNVAELNQDYIHETTPCKTGIFSEYIRNKKGSVRSFHPVFSITANGKIASELCNNVSSSGFGYGSGLAKLFDYDAKSVCIGFDFYSGHIVTTLHVVETLYGVPYYYNKILRSKVFKDNKLSYKEFILNVRFRDFDIQYNYKRYIDYIDHLKHIKSSRVGTGKIYLCNFSDILRDGINLLNEDIYSFLEKKPLWREKTIPFEGSIKDNN